MRLDFNVLWVDDQERAVKSQREKIERLIKKEGFRLQVIFAPSVAEALNYLADDVYGDHIDLVLMDYDLGSGDWGDKGLLDVRAKFPYKDIIFYSSQASDVAALVADKKIQGVFCSSRNDLPDTVDGVFDALVKKVLDIDHSRGIVMGATSDIDHYVTDCLISSFNGCDGFQKQDVLATVARHIKEKRKNFEKDAKEILEVKHVSDLLAFHYTYTSHDRLKLLKFIIKNKDSLQELKEKIDYYLLDTVPKRNKLAHVKVKIEGFSRRLIDKNNNELTSEKMRELRLELLEFQLLVEQFSQQLNVDVVEQIVEGEPA